MSKSTLINKSLIEQSMSYESYRKLINELLAEDKVTGDFMKNNKWILDYTKMNNQRMDRGEAIFKVKPSIENILKGVEEKWLWLVITEGWCGDAAQIIPAFVAMADLNPKFSIKFILRDKHPEVIDQYLTNGGRSIPKVILLNADSLEEIGNWGPRPAVPQKMTMDFKKSGSKDFDSYAKVLHKWYEDDRFETIQKEFLECLQSWR